MVVPTPRLPRLAASRARLYRTLRTAHLERAHRSPDVAILYTDTRYDFEPSLAEGLEVVRSSPGQAALVLSRSRIEVLEVNEPLMTSSVRMTALAVAAIRLRDLVSRRRTRIVSYAIGNADPWSGAPGGALRPRARALTERLLARWIWSQLDRVCFGTPGAEQTYRETFGGRRSEQRFIPALPAPLGDLDPGREDLVVFLGALTPRKGFDLVLAAWPAVRRRFPGATLTVLGKGELEAEALAAAADDPSIDVLVDPARQRIEDVLRRARVLALPSQRTPTWREQVGLPIVEGLAAGCSIVTTTETGLAAWLAEHEHAVIPPRSTPDVLAEAIVEQLERRRPPAEVAASLPAEDGRLAADAWLFADRPDRHPTEGDRA